MEKLNSKQAAEKLGISVVTLRRWDKKGILKAYRTLTNRCYYTEDQLNQFIHTNEPVKPDPKLVLYLKPNYSGKLYGDGTFAFTQSDFPGTYHLGVNYIFMKTTWKHDGTVTVVTNAPAQLTIDQKLKPDKELKPGSKNDVFLHLSEAAYQTILKANQMQLLNIDEIDYFDLEQEVFHQDHVKKEG